MELDLFRIPKNASIQRRMTMLMEMLLENQLTDWRQAPCHPESFEAETWGSGNIVATSTNSERFGRMEFFATFGDSPPMILTINALNSIEPLIKHIIELQGEIDELKTRLIATNDT